MSDSARGQLIFFLFLLAVIGCSGCTTVPLKSADSQTRVAALQRELRNLDTSVDPEEAALLAQTAVEQAAILGAQYHAFRPPWVHNSLVNIGLRSRGLCYQWANDLYPIFYQLSLRSLELHLAVSKMDKFLEHHCIVVTARGQPFSRGVILDGWRHAGRLWFGRFEADPRHPWKPLPRDRVAPELEKFMPPITEPVLKETRVLPSEKMSPN